MTATLPYNVALDAAAARGADTDAAHGRALAQAVRLFRDSDDALNAPIMQMLGLNLAERAELLFQLLPHVETEDDVRRATEPADLERLTGYVWDGEFADARAEALQHAQLDTDTVCVQAVRGMRP